MHANWYIGEYVYVYGPSALYAYSRHVCVCVCMFTPLYSFFASHSMSIRCFAVFLLRNF